MPRPGQSSRDSVCTLHALKLVSASTAAGYLGGVEEIEHHPRRGEHDPTPQSHSETGLKPGHGKLHVDLSCVVVNSLSS